MHSIILEEWILEVPNHNRVNPSATWPTYVMQSCCVWFSWST